MQLKRISLWTIAAAIAAEGGVKNLAVSALLTIGTPAASASFVYEIMQMRRATLEREAKDRSTRASHSQAAGMVRVSPGDPEETGAAQDGIADESLGHRLAVMIMARRQILDIYGDERQMLPPVYQRIAQGMLAADNQMFEEIDASRKKSGVGNAGEIESGEQMLRGLHEQLAALLIQQDPDQSASNGGPLR